MTQVFNITIGGVAKAPSGITISEEMNRFYDVATFTLNEEPQLELPVIINYGDKTFTGFIYTTRKTGRASWMIECRTEGAKLTEPYSPSSVQFEDATTSHELCTLYSNESGIPINITAENLDFGGSYERTGTMLSALQNIAHVTGAEYWDDGSTIQIQPNKPITTNGLEVPPDHIQNFLASTQTIYNKGVGFITIRNGGSESSDIISINGIYAEINECDATMHVFPNPAGALEKYSGTSDFVATNFSRQETKSVLDVSLVRLDGAIDSIESILLNGVVITDYNFEIGHNVLYFNTIKRGTITVNYIALGYTGKANISLTPVGSFITFDLFYLDQLLQFQGFLSGNCLASKTDGDMTCIVPSDTYYNEGFDLWTIGGVPEFIFYNRITVLDYVPTSVASDYTSVESATLEQTDTGYRYATRYALGADQGARSDNVDVPYTTSYDAVEDIYYFEFLQYYPKVTVSYTTPAVKHSVIFDKIEDGSVTMVIRNDNTDQICEYPLDSKFPCQLLQDVPIDIASELGLEVTAIAGVTLTWVKPDEFSDSAVVDSFGILAVYVATDGKYVIDTGSVKPRTSITLTANVNG